MDVSRFTILIVPSSKASLRKFHITSRYLFYGLIALATLIAIGLGTFVHYFTIYRQAQAFEKVSRENAALRDNLKQAEVATQKLNRKISALTRLSTRLKAIAGMPQDQMRRNQNLAALPGMGGVSFGQAPGPGELVALEQRAALLERNLNFLKSYIDTEKPFSTPSVYPTEGFISSSFGSRFNPFTNLPDFHQGIDISNDYGTPVFSTAQGKVIHAGYLGSFGLTVQIEHENGISTLFGHLSKLYVKLGDEVGRSQKIGLMGSSGMSTGPHLHYEVRINEQPVNPKPYLTRRAS